MKSLLHSAFSLIAWNTKLWIKELAERPQQTLASYVHISWRDLRLLCCYDYFLRHLWFRDIFWKAFLITFKLLSRKSNVNKIVKLISFKCRKIITVITITHFKLKFKKVIKESGTNFVFFSRSRNIGWFMITYLHEPVKILQFLSRWKIQKCLT